MIAGGLDVGAAAAAGPVVSWTKLRGEVQASPALTGTVILGLASSFSVNGTVIFDRSKEGNAASDRWTLFVGPHFRSINPKTVTQFGGVVGFQTNSASLPIAVKTGDGTPEVKWLDEKFTRLVYGVNFAYGLRMSSATSLFGGITLLGTYHKEFGHGFTGVLDFGILFGK